MNKIAELDAVVKAVAPILGVSVGRWDDRKTWRIDFADAATEEQKRTAASVVASFDYATPSADETRRDSIARDAGRSALVERLGAATAAEIDAWVEQSATNLAGTRAVLKSLLKLIASDLRCITQSKN